MPLLALLGPPGLPGHEMAVAMQAAPAERSQFPIRRLGGRLGPPAPARAAASSSISRAWRGAVVAAAPRTGRPRRCAGARVRLVAERWPVRVAGPAGGWRSRRAVAVGGVSPCSLAGPLPGRVALVVVAVAAAGGAAASLLLQRGERLRVA